MLDQYWSAGYVSWKFLCYGLCRKRDCSSWFFSPFLVFEQSWNTLFVFEVIFYSDGMGRVSAADFLNPVPANLLYWNLLTCPNKNSDEVWINACQINCQSNFHLQLPWLHTAYRNTFIYNKCKSLFCFLSSYTPPFLPLFKVKIEMRTHPWFLVRLKLGICRVQNSCVMGLGKRTTNGRSMLLLFIKKAISIKTKHNCNISFRFYFFSGATLVLAVEIVFLTSQNYLL